MGNRRRKMMLIINPISGNGHNLGRAERISERLARADIDVEICPTGAHGDAAKFAAEAAAARSCDAVLACGGDGTVNEVAGALRDTPMVMGIIPTGSGNGLARHLQIPVDPLQSLQTIIDGHTTTIDYGTVNGLPFMCTCGIGYDAAVSDRFATAPRRGKITYIKSAIEEIVNYRYQTYTISADNRTITDQALLVAACNASQYGNNVYIAPGASLTDGCLDLIIIRKAPLIQTALLGVDLLAGTINRNRLIETLSIRRATITRAQPGPAHIDGEPVKLPATLEISVHPHGLTLYAPAEQAPFQPILTPAEDLLRDISITLNNLLPRI